MWRTNLKIVALVAGLLGLYMFVANSIPQIQSEVPQEMDVSSMTPEQMVSAGEHIFNGAGGCTACHGLGTRAPNLLTDEHGQGTIGARCGGRKPGMSCKDYLWESLTQPTAYVVAGYQPIMPDQRRTLPPEQLWAVVAFLESNGGSVDVTADDVRAAMQQSGGAAPAAAAPAVTGTDPRAIINAMGCLGCHKLGSEGGEVGPPFNGMGTRLTRDYIRESILEPSKVTARGYEAMRGVMPPNFGTSLNGAQLESLVNFLASQR
jgi:mono/diheme cytochrome c family protein